MILLLEFLSGKMGKNREFLTKGKAVLTPSLKSAEKATPFRRPMLRASG